MSFIAGILAFLLIANCGALALLILVQLPKKDAGAGLAFGGGAADALFGSGSGNALTKITKWATVSFVVLTLFLGVSERSLHSGNTSGFEQAVEQQQQMQTSPQIKPSAPSTAPTTPATAPQTPAMPLTPVPAAPAPATTNGK